MAHSRSVVKGCLVDSDVLIDALNNHEAAHNLLEHLVAKHNPYMSFVSRIEVLSGARDRVLESTVRVLDSFEMLSLDRYVADRAATLVRTFRKSHSGINLADYLIAATAMEYNLELVTNNVKHFPMIKKLEKAYER